MINHKSTKIGKHENFFSFVFLAFGAFVMKFVSFDS
jgi:hypothetical protein